MALPNRKYGNINIKIGSGAKIKAKNTIMGAAQVNIGMGKDMRQPANTTYGDVSVDIAGGADIETESFIAGAGEVNLAAPGTFMSIFNGDQLSADLFKEYGVRMDLPFNADKKNEKQIKEFMKNDPPQVLTLMKSICLVLSETTLGTGFLATIPDYDGVILFSAGHNFLHSEESESSESYTQQLKDNFKFHFNCLDGNPRGPGVITIRFADLMQYDPTMILACKGVKLTSNNDESTEVDKDHDFFALVLNKKAKDDLEAKHKLEFLSCPDWTVPMDHPPIGEGEPLFYAGYPVLKKSVRNADPLRFSFGNCKRSESSIKIVYDMDTHGGASGSPVLDGKYKVVAIHTKKDNKNKHNIGNILKIVYKELKRENVFS